MVYPFFFIIISTSIILFVIILVLIVLYVYSKSHQEKKRIKWYPFISLLVQETIFFEGGVDPILIDPSLQKLLKISSFRNYLIEELINVKVNLTGNAVLNIVKLYEQLNLYKDSIAKLNSAKWHLKAKGIQELALMDQRNMTKAIFKLTNYKNVLVRTEAQCALVIFFGIEGLRFLNVTTFPISEWQQIKLLDKLGDSIPNHFTAIKKWLQSANTSVVVFALKLAGLYKCYDLYMDVVKCLKHSSQAVNIQAIQCLQQIYNEDTSEKLIENYNSNSKKYKILTLQSLQGYNYERETEFLMQQLSDTDDDIKFEAAKALSGMPGGNGILSNYHLVNEQPWKQIILQTKSGKQT